MSSSKPVDRPCVYLASLGCPKNEVDAEVIQGLLSRAGYALTHDPQSADVVVVNTCAFLAAAQRESIHEILTLAQWKAGGSLRALVVTGCLAERHGRDLLAALPEVDAVVGPGRVGEIARAVAVALRRGERVVLTGELHRRGPTGPRLRAGAPHTAYVKIADGCNQRCAFCLIPQLRGPLRSRSTQDIVREVARLDGEGVREAILVAQDTSAYGRDLPGRVSLAELLARLMDAAGPEWLRVLYTQPNHWTDPLIRVFARGGRLLPYVDVPIQHSEDVVLAAMGRGRTGARLRGLLARLRERIPDLILRTTVMTGHPGEGAAQFEALLHFLGEFPFDRLGVFAYSPEAETRSARLSERPTRREALHRRRLVLAMQHEIAARRQQARCGKTLPVLVEAIQQQRHRFLGRSYGEAPEIDGIVRVRCPRDWPLTMLEPGEFVPVRVTSTGPYDLWGVPQARELRESPTGIAATGRGLGGCKR